MSLFYKQNNIIYFLDNQNIYCIPFTKLFNCKRGNAYHLKTFDIDVYWYIRNGG